MHIGVTWTPQRGDSRLSDGHAKQEKRKSERERERRGGRSRTDRGRQRGALGAGEPACLWPTARLCAGRGQGPQGGPRRVGTRGGPSEHSQHGEQLRGEGDQ
eukprot:1355136-Alexandrium_andersonii.AAC.1